MSKQKRFFQTGWPLMLMCVLLAAGAVRAQDSIKPPTAAAPSPPPPPPKASAPASAPAVRVQEDAAGPQEDEARQIYFDYAESRPKKGSAPKSVNRSARRYQRRTPKASAKPAKPTPASQLAQVGVTVWRLRPSGAEDAEETRILEQEEEESGVSALTPVRIEADTTLSVKDKVRLSVESPRAGYLYVIDREVYRDGTRSAPYLIFPTLRTRGGDNKVSAGMLVDIPALDDRPNYFTVKFSRPDQVGEELTMIVSDKPLDIPQLQRRFLRLDEAQVAEWERKWKTDVERFEMEGGAGQAWTAAEKAAATTQDGTRLLDQEAPGPQTIYRLTPKPGSPVLITVPLRYQKNSGQ